MKLYYMPGACSLSPHIALREAGVKFDLVKVDGKTKKTEAGADFNAVNPKSYVPALELDNGRVLTEGAAIVQYIADKNPNANLAPAAGSDARYDLLEWLTFISSEIHKGTGALFNPQLPADWKKVVLDKLAQRYDHLNKHLEKNQFVLGKDFSVADAYLFTVVNWANFVGIDLGKWPALKAYQERVAARPAVQAALKAEGLLKAAA
ncbi:MAG: glutathione transferase GstA [Alphaproteobacteria bacterium]|nr:glutathione transferase GstA [Alphaproteobacteria bacterium]